MVSFTNPDLRPEERHYRTVYDPDTFNVQVSIFNGQTVVTASDENRPSPQVLATVTDTDAKYYGLTQDKVGELWRDRIQIALSQALQERSPQALKAWSIMAISILLGAVVLSIVSWLLYHRLAQVKHDLEHQRRQETPETKVPLSVSPDRPPAAAEDTAEQRFDFLNRLKQNTRSAPAQYSLLNFCRLAAGGGGPWLLFLGEVAIAFYLNPSRFPLVQLTRLGCIAEPKYLLVWFVQG